MKIVPSTASRAASRIGIRLLAALAILVGGTSASFAALTTFNAAAEFTGVQGGATGVWSYGRRDGATFTAAAFYDGANFRGPGAGGFPYVGAGYMHPGCVGAGDGATCLGDMAFANLRFTAPTDGTYTATFQVRLSDPLNNPVNCEYRGCDLPGRADYRRDGVRMWLGSGFKDLSTWQGADAVAASFAGMTLSETFTLAAGQSIDFSVDHNGARTCPGCVPLTRFNLYDSTNYTASVTLQPIPIPGSALLMAVALPLLAWRAARRRN